MKNLSIICSISFLSLTNLVFAQEVPQSQVPSIIVNNFQQAFPKAFDVEWNLDSNNYKVEFETGYKIEHEIWYDKTGKLLRQTEEISKSNLPQKVLDKISIEFKEYHTDEIMKIIDDSKTLYSVELKSNVNEWKTIFDVEGNVLSKIAD